MTTGTLLTRKPGDGALEVYGDSQDIKVLAERIKLCLPGGSRLQLGESLALAQLSVAYTLNPFNGEVWYIPGKGSMVGIKGLRKAARKQAQYWVEHVLLTQEERDQLDIPETAIAYKCLIYRTDLIRQSAEAIKLMHDAGMTDAAERYAYKPTVGIGYWLPTESTKMRGDQAARKRAEADALKIAFDLPFANEVGNGDRIGYVDDEWEQVAAPQRRQPPTEEQVAHNQEVLGYNLDDDDPLGIDTRKAEWRQEAFAAGEDGNVEDGQYREVEEPAPEPAPEPPKTKSDGKPGGTYRKQDMGKRVGDTLILCNKEGANLIDTADMFSAWKEIHGEKAAWPFADNDEAWVAVVNEIVAHKTGAPADNPDQNDAAQEGDSPF